MLDRSKVTWAGGNKPEIAGSMSAFVTSCSLLSSRYIDSSKLETTSLLYLLLTNGASTIDDGGHGGQGLGPLQLLVAAELGRHRGGDQGVGAAGSNGDDDRYAKIRPRTRPGQLQEPGERMVTSKSQDMWAAPASR